MNRRVTRPVLLHSARTALATVASLLVARVLRLPEAYWAPITTIIITQSSLGSAWKISCHRLAGTALGGLIAAVVASQFGSNVLTFGIAVFILGLLCHVGGVDISGYRFGGITLIVVTLIPWSEPAWQIAFLRVAVVSIGIGVALMFAWVWPEREPTPLGQT
jgi:uncharacterized membrane protein YgaE (UPF0421/DUF939 family)